MEKELQSAKEKLRKTEQNHNSFQDPTPVSIGDPETMKSQFFASGLQNWYEIYSDLTFSSCFLDLEKAACEEIVLEHEFFVKNGTFSDGFLSPGTSLNLLEQKIDQRVKKNSWLRFFVKHSTRSPKDSPILVDKARADFVKMNVNIDKSLEEVMKLFTELIRNHYSLSSGREAIELLVSSDKLADVCNYALEDTIYDSLNNQIVLREWKNALPLMSEFRGFVWEGSLNAISPYYHWLFFPELMGKEEIIKRQIYEYYELKIRPFLPISLKTCQIDFTIVKEEVKIIEINPFDGKALGSFPISTGLFMIENPRDFEVIQKGPLELRIRVKSLANQELKFKLDKNWREVLKKFT